MENQNKPSRVEEHYKRQNSGKFLYGLLFISAGTLWALSKGGVDLPPWLFSWGTFFIAIGLVSGVKHQFQIGGWMIPVFIGAVFLTDQFYPLDNVKEFLFPIGLVLVGLIIIFKPKQRFRKGWKHLNEMDIAHENHLEVTTIFGGAEKKVTSKDFRGGEVTSIFGGSTIDFMSANINGPVVLEVTAIMGGSKLIIPGNWLVKSEVTAVMGGVEDKRFIDESIDENKVLIIRGTTIMGGLEISSH